MKIMIRINSYILTVLLLSLSGLLSAKGAVRIHCAEDTVKVNRILKAAAERGGSFGDRCAFVAREMAGTKLGEAPDNDSIGTLMVDFHAMDRMSFINNVMALAEASTRTIPRFEEYVNFLERYSRRKGKDEGFASQFLYGSDWIVDNVYRGNLKKGTMWCSGLKRIYIPEKTVITNDEIFEPHVTWDSPITIYGQKGSRAQEVAEDYGMEFVEVENGDEMP